MNALTPGWIATQLTEAPRENPARSEAIISRPALRRWGDPRDVAGAVGFLAFSLAAADAPGWRPAAHRT